MRAQQKTRCRFKEGCSIFGGPCPGCECVQCDGHGYVPGDPEAAPIEECDFCGGTGCYVETSQINGHGV